MKTEKINISVSGMTCGHCEKHVKNVLLSTEGVKEAEVSHAKGSAEVTIEEGKVKKEDLIQKINETQTYTAK